MLVCIDAGHGTPATLLKPADHGASSGIRYEDADVLASAFLFLEKFKEQGLDTLLTRTVTIKTIIVEKEKN